MKNNIEKYQQILCTYCTKNKECSKDKIIVTNFNNTKNIKCYRYEYINKEKID